VAGEPSKRLRKWIQTDLCMVSREAILAAGRRNSPFLFFRDSEDTVGRVHRKHVEAKREWGDAPPLDRLLTRDRRETEEIKAVIPKVLGSDEVPIVNPGGIPLKG